MLLVPLVAGAHEVRPGYLELRADEAGRVSVLWKLPVLDGRMLPLTPLLPEHCTLDGEPSVRFTRDARMEQSVRACGAAGLDSGRIVIDGLPLTLVDVLVRIERPSGTISQLLKADEPEFDLASAEQGAPLGAYFSLGIEHILLGFDHLAFVLGLMVLVRSGWMLVRTITAFTIAHSLTLALATFGTVAAPPTTIEALIALSILMLAVEIVQRERAPDAPTLLVRAPWLVAFAFGLLHGFGFAGALTRLGLPADAIPLTLLLFNLGVEAGQLLFVVAVLGVMRALAPRIPALAHAPLATAYLIGVPSVYWSTDRITGLLGVA
ncbi:MAG: HupE/UreJ family protein [Pseudomonadales bacterium]|jgi:hypothetical protein|nr:HupE/UreJ family protein [Pseudomonadales bacterium]